MNKDTTFYLISFLVWLTSLYIIFSYVEQLGIRIFGIILITITLGRGIQRKLKEQNK